jgi:hypothetical protein
MHHPEPQRHDHPRRIQLARCTGLHPFSGNHPSAHRGPPRRARRERRIWRLLSAVGAGGASRRKLSIKTTVSAATEMRRSRHLAVAT